MRPTLLILLSLCLSSCCTLLRGPERVRVTSDPPGAQVSYGRASGVTPCVLNVSREWDPQQFRAQLGDKFAAQEIARSDTAEVWVYPVFFVECLLLLPGLVEIASGDIFSMAKAVHVDFKPPAPYVLVTR